MHFEEEDSNVAIFSCPEEGCVKTFERYSSMQRHLDCGKHQRALERHTLLDSEQRQAELFTFRLVKQNLFERSNWVNLHGAIASEITFAMKKLYHVQKQLLYLLEFNFERILRNTEYVFRCLKTVWNFLFSESRDFGSLRLLSKNSELLL